MRQSLSDGSAFDQVALAISRAALDPAAWLSVVREFGRVFPGLRSQIIGWDTTHENCVPQYHDGYPEEFVAPYAAHFRHINPWIPGWSKAPVGMVVAASDTLSEADLVRTEFYNDWVRPQDDMLGGGGVVLFADASRNFMLGGNVPKKYQDVYEEAFLRLLVRATPLMQQALEVNRQLLGLRLDAFALRLGAEPAEAAILVLGEGRTLVFANWQAQELLEAGDILRLSVRGRVEFVEPNAQSQLDRAIRPENHQMPLTFAAGRPIDAPMVRAVPLTGHIVEGLNVGAVALSQRPSLVLVLQRPSDSPGDIFALLGQVTGLSRTEAEIAIALCDGQTLAEIAQQRGVSIHTARNQLKSALAKTDTHRQAELVRRVEQLRWQAKFP